MTASLPDKVTREHVESVIAKVEYYNPPGTTLTLCMIHCKNGFVAIGESACVDPNQYDQALGEKYSYEQAFDKVWAHEGYVLQTKRYEQLQALTKYPIYMQRSGTRYPSDATMEIYEKGLSL